jgi:AcrR family transcriptional regulator
MSVSGQKRKPIRATAKMQPAARRRRKDAAPLERERIVATALAIVDRDGLKALSMRRLGAELGVDPMAVYYYLPNKQALFDAIVEAVMAGIDLAIDDPKRPPEERILRAAQAYCAALMAHANAMPILLEHGPATPVALRPVELLVGILRDAGLPPAEALAGMNVIAAAVRGAVGMGAVDAPGDQDMDDHWSRLSVAEFPHLAEALTVPGATFEKLFDFGIRALARGLLAEVRA